MEVELSLVDKLATLAKLKFEPAEKEAIRADLEKILGFMDKLDELDTTGIEPLVYVGDAVNVMREDDVVQTITREEALQNAPMQDGSYFKVPKVINRAHHE
ncbi:Asp-tRNA(Asn)/Glu-tRNA(Gln) amidotransferase subunit GatC [soil metagenome]